MILKYQYKHIKSHLQMWNVYNLIKIIIIAKIMIIQTLK